MATTATLPKKKKISKRRRISKHVAEAQQKAAAAAAAAASAETKSESVEHVDDGDKTTTTSPKKALSDADHSIQATAYLKAYKTSKLGEADGGWKFSKNTQTWIIKHMYNADIISKSTFSLLLEYMLGLQGKTRMRVLQEATDRILQYKEYEARQSLKETQDEDENDEKAQEKRKEYKRARQIVLVLQEEEHKPS
jgi:hypothetical protein